MMKVAAAALHRFNVAAAPLKGKTAFLDSDVMSSPSQRAVIINFKGNKKVPEEDGWLPQAELSSAALYVNVAPSLLSSSSD